MTDPDVAAMKDALRAGLDIANIQMGRSWYRALDPNGAVWCESSDPGEVAASVRDREGFTLERMPMYLVWTPWEPWVSDAPGRET